MTDVDEIVKAFEDRSQFYAGEVRIEVVEPPSIDFFPCVEYRDGVRSVRVIPTAIVGLQFWEILNRKWTRMGIRYVPVQYITCIPWTTGSATWYKDRVFVLEQTDDLKPSRPKHLYRWRLKYQSYLPWYKNPYTEGEEPA